MKNTFIKSQKTISVSCGEVCISNECTNERINLSNHDYQQISANVTTKFDKFVDTPQDLPDRIIDLLHIASYVFCADRRANRGDRESLSNSSWSRSWEFTIPVLDYDFWTDPEVIGTLADALTFMTGDKSYSFHFKKATQEPLKMEAYQTNLFSGSDFNFLQGKKTDVMLFSGGLDSLAGAIERLNTFPDRQLCLINHMSNNRTIRTQRNLVEALKKKYPGRIFPYTFECRFKKLKSRDETQRTRMFLFSAIAFAICNFYSKDELFIYENGVTSLNLSKQTDVINARSSRTTHPKVIGLLQKFYSHFSNKFSIQTPYYCKTKEDIINIFKKYNEVELIQSSVSCSSTRNKHEEFPHCGCCSQCIDRRFAVYAAGLQEMDYTYALDITQDPLDNETRQRISSLLYFAENGIGDSKYEFLKKHPQELLDIIDYWPRQNERPLDKEKCLDEIYDLYCHYRDSIKRAVENIDKSFSNSQPTIAQSIYARVQQQVDYVEERQRIFDEKIKSSVFVLNSQSDNYPRQGSGFYLNDYGLLTSYHVVDDKEFYNVCTCEAFPKGFKVVGIGLNLICKSEDIDYSLFNMDEDVPYFFQLGDSNKLRLGDPVKMIGYSDFSKGDSWDVISTSVRKTSRLFGHPLYLVDKNVFHGASGGIVLDKNDQIIGLICAGIASMDLPANNSKQGFIPINTVLQDIEQQGF